MPMPRSAPVFILNLAGCSAEEAGNRILAATDALTGDRFLPRIKELIASGMPEHDAHALALVEQVEGRLGCKGRC